MLVKIAKIGDSAPVSFACYELKNYLSKIDKNNDYAILTYDRYDESLKGMLWVGRDELFPLPVLDDRELDDGISIDVKNCVGYPSRCRRRDNSRSRSCKCRGQTYRKARLQTPCDLYRGRGQL